MRNRLKFLRAEWLKEPLKSIKCAVETEKMYPHLSQEGPMLTRDQLIREYRARSGSLPALLLVYLAIVGTMAGTAYAIL